MKKCSKCGIWKSREEFHKRNDRPNGLQPKCKECARRLYKRPTPEKRREYSLRDYYKHKAKRLATMKQYREQPENKKKMNEYKAAWFERNPEKRRAYYEITYSRTSKDASRAKHAKRKAFLNGNGGVYTEEEWVALKKFYKQRCLACGKKCLNPEPDHVIPLSKKGRNDIANIQPLCMWCNRSKGAKCTDYRPQKALI